MQCDLTYVHHDCFVLRLEGRTFLFDYPDESWLPREAAAVVPDLVGGADLYVLHSHSHGDHFTPAVIPLAGLAERVHYLLSWDVLDSWPAFEAERNVTMLEPGQERRVEDMRIVPFESTDLGVGVLLDVSGRHIWFGGDLAHWAWPELGQAALDFSRREYEKVLDELATVGVDLAMVNAEPHLENWSGAGRFLERVQPRYMAPMHSFGMLDAMRCFIDSVDPGPTRLLGYDAPGERQTFEL